MTPISANFDFLGKEDAQLVRLGALAERYFKDDPNTCLIKLRQFGEVLAQLTAAKAGLFSSPQEQQPELLRRLKFERVLPDQPADLFHQIRIVGNRAMHEQGGNHAEALTTLKLARELGVWFYRTFANAKFSPGPFVPPPDPSAATKALHDELKRLRGIVSEAQSETEKARLAVEAEARERMTAQERARQESADRAVWEQLAGKAEQAKAALAAQLEALQAAAVQAVPQTTLKLVAKAEAAAEEIDIDEASTRTLIDAQLAARGWNVDTQNIRYSAGSRPVKGRNMAIAEWPTKSGPSDYALFTGTRCIGVVEATPALHTVSIFGDPVYKYSYREAVIDGYLIDHDPPVEITTALSQAGIKFKKGEQIELIDTHSGKIDLAHVPDELHFEVEGFNKAVVTVPFNKVIAEELARHIDPNLPGKTLIFAATDAHADIVVDEIKKAFSATYGEIEDAAVRKITGSVDRVGDLIRSFRNDAFPKIAVTVDLLTTGIDVPSIENLVFLRRVNSRILYEQMLGRATRQCPEIGKETFRIGSNKNRTLAASSIGTRMEAGQISFRFLTIPTRSSP